MRTHRCPQPPDRGQHNRGQQHHGGVQAQRRGDGGGDHEDLPQQALGAEAATRHRRPGGLEEAFVVAHFGQYQHRAQESDDA